MVVREPVGETGVIAPLELPQRLTAWKAAPSLAPATR